jgi:hypothetical protein
MTALDNVDADPLEGGARVSWDAPPSGEGIEEVRVRWRTTAGPGTYSSQLTFGLGSDAGGGRRYGDLLGLPAVSVDIEVQPFREA